MGALLNSHMGIRTNVGVHQFVRQTAAFWKNNEQHLYFHDRRNCTLITGYYALFIEIKTVWIIYQ
jgi:hypothetical protein